ncbi:MAG: hypothetical protein RL071_1709 [Pseudomonadota bacterium]
MPTRAHAALALLLLPACSDYNFSDGKGANGEADDTAGQPADGGGGGQGDGGQGDGGGGGTTTPEEECNGIDDDGDGAIDEDFPDTDGDGVPDCRECEVDEITTPGAVTIDEACASPDVIVTDPWNVAVEWRWSGLSTDPSVSQAFSVPVVGNLIDTDLDGDVDLNDHPIIVVTAFGSGYDGTIVALDGVTRAEIWAVGGISPYSGAALADVDGDGRTDVLTFNIYGQPMALRGDGSVLWTSPATTRFSTYPQVAVADLQGDGDVEVLAQELILDGRSGAVEVTVGVLPSVPYWIPTAADLDQDGVQEIIFADIVYEHTGAVRWRAPFAGTYGHWAAVIDADGDPEAEVVMLGAGYLGVYEPSGAERSRVAAGTAQPGAPCVADFDGDGSAEIGWASTNTFQVHDLGGALVWSKPVADYSGLSSCSGYDVDGDGVYEVLYADEDKLYILDGATGAVHFEDAGHASGTLWEYPSVADTDGDGSAEILISSNNYGYAGWSGLTVFGHNGSGWQKAGPAWHTHDFAVTNINPDGSVPARPAPWWQIYNVYRARPAVDTAAVNLQGQIVDVCASGCATGDEVLVTARLQNLGGADSAADVPLALYSTDGAARRLVATATWAPPIAGGVLTPTLTFAFDAGLLLPGGGLELVVDDDGTGASGQTECDESDNLAAWTEVVCP